LKKTIIRLTEGGGILINFLMDEEGGGKKIRTGEGKRNRGRRAITFQNSLKRGGGKKKLGDGGDSRNRKVPIRKGGGHKGGLKEKN